MRERDHQIGLHGLALLRLGSADAFLPTADPAALEAAAAEHRAAIAQLVAGEGDAVAGERDDRGAVRPDDPRRLPEVDARTGYDAWSVSYDGPGNRTVRAEGPAVHALLEGRPPGVAVDAGCGTGRHTAELVRLGHTTIGVDASPGMLAKARERVPAADLREGDLRALPVPDATADVAVSGLALSHLPQLHEPISELARVLKPGGVLVLSNPHPLATAVLGARAWYRDERGERQSIPEYAHPLGVYLDAFAAAGLTARRLLEPAYDDGDLAGLPAAVVWLAVRG